MYYEGESDFWSYCNPRCRGEVPGPDSEYNLAAREHHQLWSSVLLDLRTYEPGYCHTYDPPAVSQPGTDKGMYFLLGHLDSLENNSKSQYMMYSFNVFLHDKAQFWDRPGMQDLGQSEVIQVRPHTELVGEFSLLEMANLDKSSKPCSSERDHSFTQCLNSYAEAESQCFLDIRFANISRNREQCPTRSLMKLFNILLWIKRASWPDLTTTTGCISKCFVRKYQFDLISSEQVRWRTVQYSTVQYSTLLYSTVQYSTIQYSK